MAQHPSLRSKTKGKAHRSVLKRFERLKDLIEKEKWNEGKSIFGLPKLKILKFKIKKEKPAEAGAAEGAEATAAGAEEIKTPEAAEKAKKQAPKETKPEAKGKEEKKK